MYNKGSANSLSSNSSSANTATSTTPATSTTTAVACTGPTDRIEWSRATILGFIEDYRRQRVLWDPNTKGYHIKQTKYEALKSLGQKYGAEIRSIRSKIKSLRSSFHREHGKVINGRRKGLNYQPMWFAYDAIRFILDGETGDSDDAEGQKNDTIDSIGEASNNNNNNTISLMGWSGHPSEEEPLEDRKISSRDIEHFNNHFLALGLQARHPMAMLAAVEAAAAASVMSAAHEKRQELDYALKQQQHLDKDDKHDVSSVPQHKIIELSTSSSNNNSSANVNLTSALSAATSLSSAIAATLNPISKPFASPKPSSPLAVDPTTTMATTPPPQLPPLPPPSALSALSALPQSQTQPSSTTTCSPENFNVLHGSRSLDENSAAIANAAAAAAAISNLPITAVTRTSDFDGSEYCNISADDVKTEIFESDSTDLPMLESTRTSTPVPLNYHKNATDMTMQRFGLHVNSAVGSGRKRKAQNHFSATQSDGDAPSPSKLLQQHSNAVHTRHCDYLGSSNSGNGGAGYSATSFANGQHHHHHPATSSGNGNTATGSKPSSTTIDEYGVFGEYVAITIRKLKTSKAKIVVKHLINNLLYEAELGKYDQGISSCKEPPELYKM